MNGTCVSVEEQINTASISGLSKISMLLFVTTGMARDAAQARSSSPANRSPMAEIFAPGMRSRLSAWILPIRPAPMIPI